MMIANLGVKGLFISGLAMFAGGVVATMQGPPPLGAPLQGLSADEMQRFNEGRNVFTRNETAPTGLGPVFNGVSCLQCHRAGAPGGASADTGISVVTRIGGMVNGVYSDLTNVGGPVLQRRSLREFQQNYPVPGEAVPPEAQFVSRRLTTPVFGAGLIEAIPDEEILKNIQRGRDPDGANGTPNFISDTPTGNLRVGRFGWKAQTVTLVHFSADAQLNEMGITNTTFPQENLPQGLPIPPGADAVPDPEDEGGADTARLTNFMKLLAPPTPQPPTAQSLLGEQIFASIRCTACHVPSMRTGPSDVPALSFQTVRLYSDLLLHDMGPGLADGIRQGRATGGQWRTAPLWGLGARPFLLHDGRATSIDQAILAHGGQGTPSRERYQNLGATDKANLIAFLSRL